ncbi:MAG: choice-of-anchor J domain-containing protein [Bacteroides sp.]|nr:choice-of-anchor J domain-containing protein [Bacteroides sp.]MCM1086327.1 choice-of-anchor J domain-containing protein [Bacteroides sp.]
MKKNFLTLLSAAAFLLTGGLQAGNGRSSDMTGNPVLAEEVTENDGSAGSDCGIKTIPYLETFDAEHWIDNNTLQCWTIIDNNNDSKTWAKDATSGFGKSACAKYTYNTSSEADDYLVSPRIELNKQATLSFRIKTGSGTEKYSVLLSTTGNNVEDFNVVLQSEQEIKQMDFQTVSIDLSSYLGETVYIAIKASSAKNQYWLYVDDFMVVSCGAPTGIMATRASGTDYEIAWNTSAGQSELSYKNASDDEFTEVFVTDTKYTLSVWEENTKYSVRVRAVCGAGDTSLYSDEFSFTTGYNCEAPTGMSVAKQDNGYELSWTNFSEKTLVYYKKSDAVDYIGIVATGQTHLFTDLQAGALYSVKLRSVCGVGDTSLFSAEYTFTTECGMANIPYLETFDAEHWITNKALLCWTIIDANGDGKTWEQDNSGYAKYSYSGSNKADDYLISPQIDLNKNAALSFKIKTGSGKEKYSVLLSKSGKNAEDFSEVLQAEQEISQTEFQTVNIDLSAYTGEEVYIAVKASSDANQYWLYVDDFMVVSCGAPTNLVMTEVTETTAKIDFASSASNFVVAYKKAPDNTWTEQNASTKPVQLSNLEPGYTYQVKVKAQCAADDESLFSDFITFTTPCFPYEFPLIEDFSGPTIPLCWDSTQWQGNKGAWSISKNTNGNYLEYAGMNGTWGKISTPDVNIPDNVDLNRFEMAMTYKFSNYDTKGERLWISYSIDKGITWDTISELSHNNTTEELSVKLGEYVAGASTIRMRLEAVGKGSLGFSIQVYDFKIRLAPICFPPTNLRIEDEILYNETSLVWTKPETSNDGAVKAYSVTYGDIEAGGNKTEEAADTAITLTGLTQHTRYEAQVRTVCQTESSEAVKIAWETPYSCLKVENLKLGMLLPTEAKLSWTSKHETFEIRYKSESGEDWNIVENISGKTYTLRNLTPAAVYTVKVRAVCGSDDASLWDSLMVEMPHGIVSVPYAENFENTQDSLPMGWRYSKLTGTSVNVQWITKTDNVKEGKQSFAYNSSQVPSGNSAIATTPLLDFSYDAVYTLEFWVRRNTSYANKKDEIRIFVGQSPADTVDAVRITSICRHPDMEPVVTDRSEDNWYHYSYELKNVEGYRYILLCGVSAYGDWIYIDDFKVNALFETNLGIVKVEPVIPRANLSEEAVYLALNNTGLSDFEGDAAFCFSVDGKDTVRENVSFAERPLAPETDVFEYTFTAKADFSEVGEHELKVWVEAEGDPAFDNAADMKVVHYEPLGLPYNTFFCDSIEQERYIRVMNLNGDSLAWARIPEDSGMYIAPNAELAANDLFFTPGVAMPAGVYEIEAVYGTATEGKTEKMQLALVSGFDTLGGIEVADIDHIAKTDTSSLHEIMLDQAGIYMLRFAAKSEQDQGGLKVFSLKVTNTLSYLDLAESICQGDTYPFGGEDLTEAGTYTDTIHHEEAADTILTLVLTVNPVYGFSLDTTVCEGQSVEFGGRTYSQAGEFKAEYKTVNGCDSIYSLKLALNPKAAAPVISGEAVEGQERWILKAVTDEPVVTWFRDNSGIEGSDTLVYVATQEGTYHATATNDCGESAPSNKIEVKFNVANAGSDMAQVPVVYPNPARETVNIKASDAIERVMMYASNGKVAKKVSGNRNGTMTISIGELNAGIYVLQVTTAGGSYNYTLVVNE